MVRTLNMRSSLLNFEAIFKSAVLFFFFFLTSLLESCFLNFVIDFYLTYFDVTEQNLYVPKYFGSEEEVTSMTFFFFNKLFIQSFYIFYLFIFWLCCAAYGILGPRPRIEPAPPALGAQSFIHWTTREVPSSTFHSFFCAKQCVTSSSKYHSTVAAIMGLSAQKGTEIIKKQAIISTFNVFSYTILNVRLRCSVIT